MLLSLIRFLKAFSVAKTVLVLNIYSISTITHNRMANSFIKAKSYFKKPVTRVTNTKAYKSNL